MSKRKKTKPIPKVRCPKWDRGVCRVFAVQQTLVYCPRARAENCGPGECCHHPLFSVRPKLEEMKRAGVNLKRYGKRLGEPAFIERLYQAFTKAKARRR